MLIKLTIATFRSCSTIQPVGKKWQPCLSVRSVTEPGHFVRQDTIITIFACFSSPVLFLFFSRSAIHWLGGRGIICIFDLSLFLFGSHGINFFLSYYMPKIVKMSAASLSNREQKSSRLLSSHLCAKKNNNKKWEQKNISSFLFLLQSDQLTGASSFVQHHGFFFFFCISLIPRLISNSNTWIPPPKKKRERLQREKRTPARWATSPTWSSRGSRRSPGGGWPSRSGSWRSSSWTCRSRRRRRRPGRGEEPACRTRRTAAAAAMTRRTETPIPTRTRRSSCHLNLPRFHQIGQIVAIPHVHLWNAKINYWDSDHLIPPPKKSETSLLARDLRVGKVKFHWKKRGIFAHFINPKMSKYSLSHVMNNN